LTLEPQLALQQTLTDNLHLVTGGGTTELVTEISPGLRLSSSGGRIKGFLNYAVRGLVYARESSSNNVQQTLNAAGSAEAVENWAYVDASASISQQNISALGTQSPDPALLNSNRTEVTSLRISPYVRGQLGGFASYEGRLNWQSTNSAASQADSTTSGGSLRMASNASLARLGWSVEASHQAIDFHASGKSETDRMTGALTFAATPELQLSTRAGRESNDLVTLNKQVYRTWGWGAIWTPTERTRLDLQREQRFFGSSHNVRFEHRMPRSVVTFSDVSDVSTDAGTGIGNGSGPRTVYDLLFTQFASLAPDPVLRAALVDAFLLNNGLTRSSLVTGGFLTSSVSLQRRTDLSYAWLGLRSTVIVSAFRNETRQLDGAPVASDDLANGNVLRQYGISANLSHRLTPLSALSVLAARTKTTASVTAQATDLRSLTATLTSRLRTNADLSLSARHSSFQSTASPYTENALIANLQLRF
jgi:uncharacterized protein (PEP-CTERM system associated)